MTAVFDIEVRAFDRASGTRLNFNPKLVESATWSYVERGGAEMATVVIKTPFESVPVANGDFLEIWTLNSGETVPRWRGIVNVPERVLSTSEKHTITAYGRMEDMSHMVMDKILLNPATLDSSGSLAGGADLCQYAAQILSDYIARLSQSTASYQPWTIFVSDIQVTNINLVQLDTTLTTCRAAMDAVADQGGVNIVWGWDIDPASGNDRFYLRPRVSAVGSQFYIGVGVEEITSPSEFQALTNSIWVSGGAAQFPNREFNASFEVPTIPDGNSGSLLADGGFEDLIGATWTFSSGAGRNSYDPGANDFGTPHSGKWYGQLTSTNATISQSVAVSLNARYVLSLYARQGNTSFLGSAVATVQGVNSSGVVTETWANEIFIDAGHGVNSTVWVGGQPSTVLGSPSLSLTGVFTNSSTVKATITIRATSAGAGESILIDDVAFNVIDSVGQTGWIDSTQDANCSVNWINWGCTDAPADGNYCVRMNVSSAPNHRTALQTSPGSLNGATGYRYATTGGETIRLAALVRMKPSENPSLTTGLVYPTFQGIGAGEAITQNNDSPPAGFIVPVDGNWYFVYQDISIFGNTTLGLSQLAMGANGTYDWDAVSARDVNAFPLTSSAIAANPPSTGHAYGAAVVQAYLSEYLRGTDFEAYLDVNNPSVQAAGLLSAAESSITSYGRREALVSNKNAFAMNADLYAWAAAWLNQFAVPIGRTRVKLVDEQSQMPDPGTAQLMRISGTSNDIPDQYSTKTTYAWGPSAKLGADIELTTQRPTLAKLLLSAAQAGAGGGSASATGTVAAAVASSQSGGNGAGNQSTPSTNFGTSMSPNVTGYVNGTNTTFVLAQAPAVGFEMIADGVRLLDGTDYAYTASTLTVVTTVAPVHWIVANIC